MSQNGPDLSDQELQKIKNDTNQVIGYLNLKKLKRSITRSYLFRISLITIFTKLWHLKYANLLR